MIMREKLKQSKRIVVKVGTSTLTYENGRLNLKRIERMAWVLSDLVNQGKEVVLVTSGAIGVGAARLSFAERPSEMKTKQAAAAVGQAVLIQIYQNFFKFPQIKKGDLLSLLFTFDFKFLFKKIIYFSRVFAH